MASVSEAWALKPLPYFRTALDGPKSWAKQFSLPFNKDSQLKTFLKRGNDAYGSNHYRFRWRRKVTSLDLQKALLPFLGSLDHSPQSLKVLARGKSGRVLQLEIGFGGIRPAVVLRLDSIRRYLTQLPSTLFVIEKDQEGDWVFSGAGFGHGVGLSQAGAIDLAKRSWSIKQILNHYYPGTKYGILQELQNAL